MTSKFILIKKGENYLMTNETNKKYAMNRTMELKKRNKLICYPKLSSIDFYVVNLPISSKIADDLKYDSNRKKECNFRDNN